jgi:hypothetical protein
MVPPHRRALCARACSSSGISMGLFSEEFLPAAQEAIGNKVMAGGTPANPATLAPDKVGFGEGFYSRSWRAWQVTHLVASGRN